MTDSIASISALPLIPVVLSGGSGTRLWPLSRAAYPKQFLPLDGGARSLIQETVARVTGPGFAEPMIICNDDHRFLVAEQMRTLGRQPGAIILEPVGRNTAPAVAVAALRAMQDAGEGGDALLLVLPSDHVIRDQGAFHAAITVGRTAAEAGRLVTFGITPTAPETGYGYIQAGDPLADAEGAHALGRFVEKPDAETARAYVADGSYSWNSGIFLLSARAYLDELEAHDPAILTAARAALDGAAFDLTFLRLDATAFAAAPSRSIDYAVMEHTQRGAVVPVDMGWSDLGAWSSLWDIGDKDDRGNVTRGDVILEDTSASFVHAESGLVAVCGLSDVIVVATDDAVLVCSRDGAQGVKQVVDRIKAAGRQECSLHSTVHRPWGSYRGVDAGERFQVKRIVVNPGERLSLQMHYHRAEHWIVVKGTARVTRDEETFLLGENESTFIRAGATHRLENPGKVPLHLIEVQSGAYLGEDDIERFDDRYGRVAGGGRTAPIQKPLNAS